MPQPIADEENVDDGEDLLTIASHDHYVTGIQHHDQSKTKHAAWILQINRKRDNRALYGVI